jgi:hypothetical protein
MPWVPRFWDSRLPKSQMINLIKKPDFFMTVSFKHGKSGFLMMEDIRGEGEHILRFILVFRLSIYDELTI